MEYMKKRGFTLVEIIITLLIFIIMASVLLSQSLLFIGFQNELNSRADAMREARVVFNRIINVLRFHRADGNYSETTGVGSHSYYFDIATGHIPTFPITSDFPISKGVMYTFESNPSGQNRILYAVQTTSGYGPSQVLTQNSLGPWGNQGNAEPILYNSGENILTLQIPFIKNGVSIPMRTTIRVLGKVE